MKALLIDCDDTLLDFKRTEKEALLPILKEFNIEETPENLNLYSKINLANWKRLELKEITREKCITDRWSEFFSHFNIEVNPKKINEAYFKRLAEGGYLLPETISFLEEAIKYYDIYIVSNGNPDVQYPRLLKSGILKYIKKTYISMEIGYNKPDPRFFDYVLKDTLLNKDDVIVIGDSLTSDIKGAILSNLDYVYFDKDNLNTQFDGTRVVKLLDFFKLQKVKNDLANK